MFVRIRVSAGSHCELVARGIGKMRQSRASRPARSVRTELRKLGGLFGARAEKYSHVSDFVQKTLDSARTARAIPTVPSAQIGAQIDDDAVGAAMICETTKLAMEVIVVLCAADVSAEKGRWYMWNMTSPSTRASHLSDCDLLTEVERAAGSERHATARLVALLMEVDSRKLFAGQGCSSLFTYCVQRLHLSEHAAYLRIEAARLARRFPVILDKLSDGSLHLTAVSLLGPHLTAGNHVELLDCAAHKSKRDVEHLVARVRPQPDVASVVRKLPAPASVPVASSEFPVLVPVPDSTLPVPVADTVPPDIAAQAAPRPPEIKPLAPERYKVQCTVSRETYEKLRRVQDLMRHTIPNGDPAVILDRALTLLLAELSSKVRGDRSPAARFKANWVAAPKRAS